MHYLTNYYKNLSEQLQERVNFLLKLIAESDTRLGGKNSHNPFSDDPGLQMFSDEPDPDTMMSDREMAGYDKRTDAEAAADLRDIQRFEKEYPSSSPKFSGMAGDYGARLNERMPVDIYGRPINYRMQEVDKRDREIQKEIQDRAREEQRLRDERNREMEPPTLA